MGDLRAGPASLVALCAAVLLLPGGFPAAAAMPARPDSALPPSAAPPSSRQDEDLGRREVRRTVAHMTLEEKVGQLFMTYVYGRNVEDRSPQAMAANRQAHGVATGRELLRRFHLGGIVYTSWSGNTINPRQIARLSNGIQRVSAHEGARLPALVATDQEGGVVARVGHPATSFPGNMALGAARSPAAARAAARAMGEELRALGISQNLAPVADVNRDPDNPVIGLRSFGSHPRLVSLLTAAQVNGYQEDAGIAATAKHFPGHGDTDTDSHAGLPVIRHTRAEVEQLDLRPFKAAIRAGVGAIMTAHIRVPVLDDSGRPATLSRPILSGVLRRELGFDGVIVTDALNMAGVRSPLGVERVPEEAIRAGADLLLLPPDIDVAYHAVLGAVRGGRISEARIDRSVRRILHLKATLGLLDDPYVEVSSAARSLGTASHRRAAAHVAEKSVTLLRNAGGLLPLMHPARRRVLVVGGEHHAVTSLTRRLAARGVRVDPLVTGSSPGAGQITEALRRLATDYDLAVVLASGARLHAGQGQLVRALAGTDKPVVGVAVAEPYDSAALTGADAVLATYDPGDKAMKALARVLLGDVRPSGRLPVSIPGGDGTTLYPFGHGLRYGR